MCIESWRKRAKPPWEQKLQRQQGGAVLLNSGSRHRALHGGMWVCKAVWGALRWFCPVLWRQTYGQVLSWLDAIPFVSWALLAVLRSFLTHCPQEMNGLLVVWGRRPMLGSQVGLGLGCFLRTVQLRLQIQGGFPTSSSINLFFRHVCILTVTKHQIYL